MVRDSTGSWSMKIAASKVIGIPLATAIIDRNLDNVIQEGELTKIEVVF